MRKSDPTEMYQRICQKLPIGVRQSSLYMEKDGYWERLDESQAAIAIYGLYPESVQSMIRDTDVKETIKRLINTPKLQLEFAEESLEKYLNLRNGVFDVETKSKVKGREGLKFSYVLDFEYQKNVDIKMAPVFQQFVTSVFRNDLGKKTRLLLQILGYCISDYLKAKAGFFFIGASNSGKSTMLELLKRILPEKSITAIPLQRLENRFNIARLAESRVNICSEISEKSFKALDIFKQITGNETVTAEHKGQKPFEFRLKCKCINAGNMLPDLEAIEGMDAVLNRMIILYFPHSIPKKQQDLKLLEKLCDERDVIFSMAIDELVKLREADFTFEEPEDTAQIKAQLISQSKVLEDFIQDTCIQEETGKVHIVTLYDEFLKYCAENLLDAKYTKTQFSHCVSRIPGVKRRKLRINGSSPLWGFEGIRLKNYWDDKNQDSEMSD